MTVREVDTSLPAILIPGPYETDEGVYGETGNHDFVRSVLEAIPEDEIYVRANVVGELSGPAGAIAFRPLTSRRLQTIIDANVRLTGWFRRGKSTEQRYVACTRDLAETILASVISFGRYRHLAMLVNYPVYQPGFIPASPGWNATSGIYYDGTTPDIITDPKTQRAVLADLIVDFPFDSDASRQNFIGLLLTPILRPALNGNAPLHLVESSIERAGKGKLVEQVLGRIVCGHPIAARQYQDNENDRDKTILALLATGATVLHFDNLNGFMDSGALASLVTAASYSGRILGQTATAEFPNTFTIVGSGNNVRMSSELVKRTIPIMLRPTDDHPEYRTGFQHPDLAEYLTEARPRALGCLLGMIDNWDRVPLKDLPLGGFESWAGAVGGILRNAGYHDWRLSTDRWRSSADVEGEDLHAFVRKWAEEGAGVAWRVRDLFILAEGIEIFSTYRTGKTRESNEIRFALKVLRKYEGRPVSGYTIKRLERNEWAVFPLMES